MNGIHLHNTRQHNSIHLNCHRLIIISIKVAIPFKHGLEDKLDTNGKL